MLRSRGRPNSLMSVVFCCGQTQSTSHFVLTQMSSRGVKRHLVDGKHSIRYLSSETRRRCSSGTVNMMTSFSLRFQPNRYNCNPMSQRVTVGLGHRTNLRRMLPRRLSTEALSEQPAASQEELTARLQEISDHPNSWTGWLDSLSMPQHQQLTQLVSQGCQNLKNVASTIPEPSRQALQLVALNTAIPFVGFGFLDNAILIVAGDAIDTSLGVVLGISTMCAAALGNIISDVAGIALGTAIEDFCVHYLKLPSPSLTSAQRQLRSVRFASQMGCAFGVVLGCFIGMFPLLFIDTNKAQIRKREAHLDQLFRDVVTSAGSLVGAARTSLYLLVNSIEEEENDGNNESLPGANNHKKNTGFFNMFSRKLNKDVSPRPASDGKYLYVKYDEHYDPLTLTGNTTTSGSVTTHSSKKEQWIPLGRGIVSRAILTGEAWNIADVSTEPDFAPDIGYVYNWNHKMSTSEQHTRSMVCVPVMDSAGRPIAVIQAINKVGRGKETAVGGSIASSQQPGPFTESDVQILKALASHISVSLQRLYEQAEGDQAETRLKDTIRLLHDYGLDAISTEREEQDGLALMKLARRPLFPDA